jgi:uncharacterized membrane protein YagU involved in acid resistance
MKPGWSQVVLVGGALLAVLDIVNAAAFWYLYRGTSPVAILQSIAAGILGRDAFKGGAATAALGLALHLFIAFGIAAVYCLGYRLWPAMLERPILYGSIYGVVVYLVMNHVVVPLSRAVPVPFIPAWFLDNLFGHILLVGIPLALVARRYAGPRAAAT